MLDAILLLLAQSTGLLAVTLLLVWATRHHPVLCLNIGRVGLLAVAGLVVASPFMKEKPNPAVPISYSTMSSPIVRQFTQAQSTAIGSLSASSNNSTLGNAIPSEVVFPERLADPTQAIVVIWLTVTGLLFMGLAFGSVTLAKIRQLSTPVDDPQLLELVRQVASKFELAPPKIRASAGIRMPFVAGVIRPTIYLPQDWVKQTNDETLQAVLYHEMAHIAHGDLRWMLFHRLMGIVFWPQFLLVLLKRPLGIAAEKFCDRHVVATGMDRHQYADCLLRMREAFAHRSAPALGIGMHSSRKILSLRIEAILDKRRASVNALSGVAQNLTRLGGLAFACTLAVLIAKPMRSQAGDNTRSWIKVPYSAQIAVEDELGRAIQNAKAWIVLTGDLPVTQSFPLETKGSTIGLSATSLPNFHTVGQLLVVAPGYGSNFLRLWPSPSKVTRIVVKRGVNVAGTVLLPNGQPAAGISVGATMLHDLAKAPNDRGFIANSPALRSTFQTVTNQLGEFKLVGIPPNTKVTIDVDDHRFAATDFKYSYVSGQSGRGKPIALTPASQISGSVLLNGRPVAGVQVNAQANFTKDPNNLGAGSAITDPRGNYQIERLDPGIYNVSLNLHGAMEQDFTAFAREAVKVSEASAAIQVNFELIPGAVIEGVVRDSSRRALSDIYVGVYGPAHPASSPEVQAMFTSSNGSFRFRVPPGKQHVYIGDDRFEQTPKDLVVQSTTKTHVDFEVKEVRSEPADTRNDVQAKEEDIPLNVPLPKQVSGARSASFGPGQPFYGPMKLKNGVIVKLAFLQDDAMAPHSIWRPDGSRASSTDRARSLNMEGFQSSNPQMRTMFARVDMEGVDRIGTHCQLQTAHPTDHTVWQTYGDPSNRSMDLVCFHAPKSLQVTDIRFGVGAGPYKTAVKCKVGDGPIFAKVWDGRGKAPSPGMPNAGLQVTIQFPKEYEGLDAMVEVHFKNGQQPELSSWQEGTEIGSSGQRTRSYGFTSGSIQEIDHIDLVTRPYEWVTFKGVKLNPAR